MVFSKVQLPWEASQFGRGCSYIMLSGWRGKDTTISSATASIEIFEGARQASLVEYRHSSVTLHCVTGA